MMSLKKIKYLWLLLPLLLIRFEVYSIQLENQIIQYGLTKEKLEFSVEYEHSVSQSMVVDYFEIDKNGVYNVGSLFQDLGGAGMPSTGQDGQVTISEEGFRISRKRYLTDHLPFIVVKDSEWQLKSPEGCLDLRQILETQEVFVDVKKENWIVFIINSVKVWMHEI